MRTERDYCRKCEPKRYVSVANLFMCDKHVYLCNDHMNEIHGDLKFCGETPCKP